MLDRDRRNVAQQDERLVIDALKILTQPGCISEAKEPISKISLMNLARLSEAADILSGLLTQELSDRLAAMHKASIDASAA